MYANHKNCDFVCNSKENVVQCSSIKPSVVITENKRNTNTKLITQEFVVLSWHLKFLLNQRLPKVYLLKIEKIIP